MIALLEVAGQLLADALCVAIVAMRPTRIVAAENLFLRRQLAMYVERGVKPRRPDVATRVSLALLSKLFEWRTSLVVVRPETLIRWHRAGFRLLWRLKSRPGRPAIPLEVRELIRRMAAANALWGEERIANELLLKLGLRVSPRTVRKYMPKRPPGRPRGDQRWATFLRNHAKAILACDFFVAVPGMGAFYPIAHKDKDGNYLTGDSSYRLHLPPNPPAKLFWSVTLYDAANSSGLDNGQPLPSLNSLDKPVLNADGSVDLYFGDQVPAGKEKNWMRAPKGKGYFAILRLYGEAEMDEVMVLTPVCCLAS